MNGRQAAKLAAQRITELEYVLARQIQDIKDYNAAIADMISGESPCSWCEECPECQLEAKMGRGCSEWWLRYRKGPEGGKWPSESPENGIDEMEAGNDAQRTEEGDTADTIFGLEEQ